MSAHRSASVGPARVFPLAVVQRRKKPHEIQHCRRPYRGRDCSRDAFAASWAHASPNCKSGILGDATSALESKESPYGNARTQLRPTCWVVQFGAHGYAGGMRLGAAQKWCVIWSSSVVTYPRSQIPLLSLKHRWGARLEFFS